MALPFCRTARERFRLRGLAAGDLARCRQLSEQLAAAGERAASASAGALHGVAALYALLAGELRRLGPMLDSALSRLEAEVGGEALDTLLETFASEFGLLEPGGGAEPEGDGEPAGGDAARSAVRAVPTRVQRCEALLAVWLLNRNAALAGLRPLFDDRGLPASTKARYDTVTESLLRLLDDEARRRAAVQAPSERLGAPLAMPSLDAQLRFVTERWTELEPGARDLALRALDVLAEERPRLAGPGPLELPSFAVARREGLDVAGIETESGAPRSAVASAEAAPGAPAPAPTEPEWMTELTLVAKHTRVWLDQLSRGHETPIERLDQIPDDELARLAEDGFTGLWLVGVWERSPASAKIKRRGGGGGASAYSIFDYRVADGLGGDAAAERLQERALRHGIRLAVDVVPNHVGVDSRWVREHPEWLLQADEPPFPGYRFTGPDLSGDPDLEIRLEDGYADRSDAAVVFQLVDRRTGRVRYPYHGNDGTSTPWNDTAQLDYTRPEVGEAMRELIVRLARTFPVLRFDAAMTLTRLHFQRLWFPAPGDGGAIPSRAEHGMSRDAFGRLMPSELWREVARDVAREAPETLLLAEAFWLMEEAFVRELGMHRVYHSAFMHCLRDRRTERLAELLDDTQAHDPGMLARYANFLTTPDEDPAAAHLGRGDRYFGACAVLATLPGLPLFGHGQVEGFGEKYGMEFERPMTEERPDPAMVERHRREIVPLMRARARLGAPVSFLMLELVDQDGAVQVDVLAYCSGTGAAAVVVAFNDADRECRGFLRARRGGGAATLALRLGLTASSAAGESIRFRELRGEPEVVLEGRLSDRGLAVDLAPWQTVAWTGFRFVG